MVLLATAMVSYWASSGEVSTLGSYVSSAIEFSAGYSEAASLEAPGFFVMVALASLAALFLGIPALAARRNALLPGLIPAAIIAFLAFKHGVVRADVHLLPMNGNLALAVCFLLVVAAAGDRRLLIAFQAFNLLLGFFIVLGVLPAGGQELREHLTLTKAFEVGTAVVEFGATNRSLGLKSRQALAELRLPETFHDVVGNSSVEVVPYKTSLVFANGWRWSPCPVFQTYAVSGPAHDRLNAEHLESERGADFVIVHGDPIDERHPYLEDPLSWRIFLSWYELKEQTPGLLLFGRRQSPRDHSLTELSSSKTRWGKDFPVPAYAGRPVMKVTTARSLLGHLSNLFFRVNPVHLEVS